MPEFCRVDLKARGQRVITGQDPIRNWVLALRLILTLILLLWAVQAVNTALGMRLNLFGIYPRDVHTLPGILLWPLLHANFEHLIMNTTPLAVLGFFVALRGVNTFLLVTLLILALGGLCVWLLGRPAFHIGASGLVFGYFGFLVAIGIYEKSIPSLGIASFAVFYYGGLIYGVLPQDSFISWEAHLFGLCAGVYAARVFSIRRRRRGLSRH